MKTAFLFPGQGGQYAGMGRNLYENFPYAAQLYNELGEKIKEISFDEKNKDINKTEFSQRAIYAMSVVGAKLLEQKGIIPKFISGSSLGEYSALAFADALDFKKGYELVSRRGIMMQEYLNKKDSAMLAVFIKDYPVIEKIISRENLKIEPAVYNSYEQIVIGGIGEDVRMLKRILDLERVKSMELKVSGAFHTYVMSDVVPDLKNLLKEYEFSQPKYSVVYNSLGGECANPDFVESLARQVERPIMFTKGIEYMLNMGVDTFIQVGPGDNLKKAVKNMDSKVKAYALDNENDLKKLMRMPGVKR